MKEVSTEFKERTIAIDFDGVIHAYSRGFQGLENAYDGPTENTRRSLEYLKNNNYRLIIVSSRPVDVINEWLEKYEMTQFFDEVTNIKRPAKYYIDDHAIRFEKTLSEAQQWPDTLYQIMQREDRHFLLRAYLQDLVDGTIFDGLEGDVHEFAGVQKLLERRQFYNAFNAIHIFERLKDLHLNKIVELGTGPGQISTVFRHLMSEKTLMWTLDRDDCYTPFCLLKTKYPSPIDNGIIRSEHRSNTVIGNRITSEDGWGGYPSTVFKTQNNTPIDVIFFDAHLNRKSLIRDLSLWLPYISENSYLFLSGAVIAHDALKVLIEDMLYRRGTPDLERLRVYRVCKNIQFDTYPIKMEGWNWNDENPDVTVGIDTKTMRPFYQLPSALTGNPGYAKESKISVDNFEPNDDAYDQSIHDVKYELILDWPGMVVLSNINQKAKTKFLKYLNDYAG